MSWKHGPFSFCLSTSLLVALTSCSNQHRVTRQEDAGRTHITFISVAPWESVKTSLQPTFPITADSALSQAVPATRTFEEKLLDQFNAALKIAMPTTGTSDEGGGKASGDISKLESPSEIVRGASALPGLPADSLKQPPVVHPSLRYLAAAALYQEVQLLNQYLSYEAQPGSGKTPNGEQIIRDPYLVRLQISVSPLARNMPYDVYSRLTFFVKDGGVDGKVNSQDVTPEVIPLLVTDSIEATLHAQTTDKVRQYALALSALIKGFGLGANAEKITEKLESIVGNDFNSLFSVGRISGNIVQVRLGAGQEVQGQYVTATRTHNVSFLVLVPRGAGSIQVTSHNKFVDAVEGTELRGRDKSEIEQSIESIQTKYANRKIQFLPSGGTKFRASAGDWMTRDVYDDLKDAVLTYDLPRYQNTLKEALLKSAKEVAKREAESQKPPVPFDPSKYVLHASEPYWWDTLWEEIATAVFGRSYSEAIVRLPVENTLDLIDEPGLTLFEESSSAQITLTKIEKWNRLVTATLVVKENDVVQYRIPSRTIVRTSNGWVTIAFPPLKPVIASSSGMLTYELDLWHPGQKPGPNNKILVKRSVTAEAQKGSSAQIGTASLDVNQAGEGSMPITVALGKLDSKTTLTVSGASISGVTATGVVITQKGNTLEVPASTTIVVTVRNVADLVTITVQGDKSETSSSQMLFPRRAPTPK